MRWVQRLEKFKRAFAELKVAVDLSQRRPLSKLEKQDLIQAFKYKHELAWNALKDYFADQGGVNITGSRDATRAAFNIGLIRDGGATSA